MDESREVMHLLFSANRWAVAAKMREELDAGIDLILDRYSFSGIAYSMAKGIEKQWACAPEVGLVRKMIYGLLLLLLL